MKSYRPYQFTLFRIFLGYYLFDFFIHLIAYATDLYSDQGIYPLKSDASLLNIFNIFSSPFGVKMILVALTVLSLLYLFGIYRRVAALLLWYGWACLMNRSYAYGMPSEGYTGWLLLASVLIPSGEPLSLGKKDPNWSLPKELYYGMWLIIGLSYSASGINKLGSISWRNGEALAIIFEGPLVRVWMSDILQRLPIGLVKMISWFSLWLEVLYAPLCLFRQTRFLAWIMMVILHLGVLGALNIGNVTFAMLITHFFVFDVRWLSAKVKWDEAK